MNERQSWLPLCRDTADLTPLLCTFPCAAPIPEASPYRGKHNGIIGSLNRWMNSENRREEALQILASSRRISVTSVVACFGLGMEK